MERFCEALAAMGPPLLHDLAARYREICEQERFAPAEHRAVFEQRGQALIAYFGELAKVHGVAFASEAGAPPQDAVSAALASLSHALDEALEKAGSEFR